MSNLKALADELEQLVLGFFYAVGMSIVYIARGLDWIWLKLQKQDEFHCLVVQCDRGTRSGSKYCLTEKEARTKWQWVRGHLDPGQHDQKRTPHCQRRFKK